MRIENLYPKPVRGDFATTNQVRDDAVATYGDRARDLLDRAGGDTIGAISLLYLAADQRKQAAEDAEPSLSEQALAATVREQRDTIDALRDEISTLASILSTVTPSAYERRRMYSRDLQVLPVGTVVCDEAGRAWTCIDNEDGRVWATPTRDDTLSSNDLAEETTAWMAWVADK